ncbi:MAG: lipoprotein-releasing system transmembrane subunit LolC [Hyphomicrobiales bacterium]|nr:MAG: lipoprotein-releasing system transmembrane subunit LolC [Hyphomicrobiales bacterium]
MENASPRPLSRFEWTIALRYLRARRKEGFISVIAGFSFLGITLGVATLIIVMAVMNGFRSDLIDKILGVNGHMMIHSLGGPFTGFDDVTARLKNIKGLKSITPMIEGQVLTAGRSASSGALARGMREADLRRYAAIAENVRQGTLDGFDEGTGVAIGSRLAATLGVEPGKQITLVSPRGAVTPFGTSPRIKAYKVAAVFEIGMSQFDSSLVFMPLKEAQAYFNKKDAVTALEVMVDDPERMDDYRALVEQAAQKAIYITDWRQSNKTFFGALQVERNVMFIILTLIILVAALNIISGLIMLVKDKSSNIAILRTMGATRGAIMRIFVITGASIGVVGTLAGLFLGTVFCWNIESVRQFISYLTGTELFSPELYYLSTMPAEMNPGEIITVVVLSLSLSFLATLYPSWRAARLDPVEALRYE